MNKKINFLLMLSVLLFTQLTLAQQSTVTGTVTDAPNGFPLPGVNILIQGTSNGTLTDFNGNYSIAASKGDVLSFSYVGMKLQTVTVGNDRTINLVMQEDAAALDEVVVVGYGTQSKVKVTGSIATVKSDDIVKNTTSNISSALSGRMAGLVTVQSSGEPGSDLASLRIRGQSTPGSNAPLVLVDGIPRDLNSLNPNDIETISVLKDAASAAIYGMRAANGVVLVTTKRGGNTTPTVSFNTYSGIQTPTRLPNFLDSYDYATLLNEANRNDGSPEPYSAQDLKLYQDGTSPDTHPNTDWVGETLNPSSMIQTYDIGVRGSYENLNYFTSLGYLYQDALYDNNSYDRFNFRSNLDVKLSKSLKFQADFSGSLEDKKRPSIASLDVMSNILRWAPTLVNQYSNGGYSQNSVTPEIKDGGYSDIENFNFQSRISLNYQFPIEGLQITGQVAYDRSAGGDNRNLDNFNGWTKTFRKPTGFTNFNPTTGEFENVPSSQTGSKASLSESRSQGYKLTTEAVLDYQRTFGKHDFSGKLIFSRFYARFDYLNASRSQFLGSTVDYFVAGDESTRDNSNGTVERAIMGYAGRLAYAYDDKYLLEFNGRYDGSFRFSPDSRWGFFPSVSAGWRISQEEFLKDNDVINELKLRGSYGELGSDELPPFRYLELYGFSSPFVDDGTLVKTTESNGIADTNTTWEKAKSYNFGVDVGLWNNKFTLQVDVFKKRTSDILLTPALQVPSTFGASLPVQNIGIVDAQGFEIVLGHSNRIGDLGYSVNFNFSKASNEIVEYAESADVSELLRQTGNPLGSRYGYIAEGLFQTKSEIDNLNATAKSQSGNAGAVYQTQNPQPGDIRYRDLNGDGLVTDADRTMMGKSNIPEITYGANFGVNYKNWDFSILFQGAAAFDMYLSGEASWAFFNSGKVFDRHLDRAQIGTDGNVINPDATYPRLSLTKKSVNERQSSYWVVAGDYLRLKNLEIGFNIPENTINKIGLTRLRIYANGRNLTTWSKIKNLDPENPQERGWFYPQQKVFSLGLNVEF